MKSLQAPTRLYLYVLPEHTYLPLYYGTAIHRCQLGSNDGIQQND